MSDLDEVMVMLFVPEMCYHRAIETHFEWENTQVRQIAGSIVPSARTTDQL